MMKNKQTYDSIHDDSDKMSEKSLVSMNKEHSIDESLINGSNSQEKFSLLFYGTTPKNNKK